MKLFLPREHGATAMLLTPIFSVAILSRAWRWSEVAVLVAAFAAISAKDPAVLLLKQQFLWKTRNPDSPAAAQWLAAWTSLLFVSVAVLFATWPRRQFLAMGVGVAAFAILAVAVNLKNRQRSTLFQIASAAALTSTSVATCIAALGTVAPWCWWFWALSTMQASAGILVVHARLDARVALRKPSAAHTQFRSAAQVSVGALACGALAAFVLHRRAMGAALAVAAFAYGYDLVRQRNPASLQMPLKTVGQQALALSIVYSAFIMAGLW